jgi:hypothetical protein
MSRLAAESSHKKSESPKGSHFVGASESNLNVGFVRHFSRDIIHGQFC